MTRCKSNVRSLSAADHGGVGQKGVTAPESARIERNRLDEPIRMLRLAQVIDATGLGKTKIYELQAEGRFPMRVKITGHSVGWIEAEVQAWLARRIEASTTLDTVMAPGLSGRQFAR